MEKTIIIILLFILFVTVNAQNNGYKHLSREWDSKALKKANTAADVDYMT